MNQLIQSILKIPKKTILLSLVITSTVLLIGFTKWRNKREVIRRKKKKKEGSVNIGGTSPYDLLLPFTFLRHLRNGYRWNLVKNCLL
jgi:hypothetical protein